MRYPKKRAENSSDKPNGLDRFVLPFAAFSEKKKLSSVVGQWKGTSAEGLLRFDSVANSRKIRNDGGHIYEIAAEVVKVGRMYYEHRSVFQGFIATQPRGRVLPR